MRRSPHIPVVTAVGADLELPASRRPSAIALAVFTAATAVSVLNALDGDGRSWIGAAALGAIAVLFARQLVTGPPPLRADAAGVWCGAALTAWSEVVGAFEVRERTTAYTFRSQTYVGCDVRRGTRTGELRVTSWARSYGIPPQELAAMLNQRLDRHRPGSPVG